MSKQARSVLFWVTTLALLCVLWPVLALTTPFPAAMFAGLISGAFTASMSSTARPTPKVLRDLTLVGVGAVAGSMVSPSVIGTVVADPVPVVLAAFGSFIVSLASGLVIVLSAKVDWQTALFAAVPGGASGLSLLARDVGADASIVLTVQYLRVLIVSLSLPFAAYLITERAPGAHAVNAQTTENVPTSVVFTLISLTAGYLLARLWSFSAGMLILPMILAIALTNTPLLQAATVPDPVAQVIYAAVGLMLGLAFSRQSLRALVTILPLVFSALMLGLIACATVGLALESALDAGPLTAYLATTPGALPVVAAFSTEIEANVGLIVTCHVLRLIAAILMGTLMASLFKRRTVGVVS